MIVKISNKRNFTINNETISILALLLIVLSGSAPWFIWGYLSPIYVGLLGLTIFLLLNINAVSQRMMKGVSLHNFLTVSLFALYFVVFQFLMWREFYFSDLYLIITLFIVGGISDKYKHETFVLYSKMMGAMVLISLITWLIHKYLVEIPTIGILDISSFKGTGQGSTLMHNHFFFVTYFDRVDRFYGVFDEPGVLGTIGAILLYANKYDFKRWYNVALLLGGIFTFSLAFYLLVLIGLAIHFLKDIKKIVMGMFVFLIGVAIVFFVLYDNPSFQQHIIARLDGIESVTGLINDRDNAYVVNNFEDLFNQPVHLLFGYGNDPSMGAGTTTSYMRWILRYGVVGFSIMCIIFGLLIKPNNKDKTGLCILLLLSFLQRPSVLHSAFVILVVLCVQEIQGRSNRMTRRSETNDIVANKEII